MSSPNESEEAIRKALRRAFSLGQTYWQQADSESYVQNRKSDETAQKFDAMVEETVASLLSEIDALRADAERYRWLRDNTASDWAICEWSNDPDGCGFYRDARATHVVDAAIDAARKG